MDTPHRTLHLARQAIGLSDPNPRVGCVIIGPDGLPWGEGHTQAVGGPHAEVVALRQAAGRDAPGARRDTATPQPRLPESAHMPGTDAPSRPESLRLRGATAWVTLEPCAHHGRTPPCCDALIAAGLARVVVALRDPNPLVGGQGLARMRAAGIDVQVAGDFHGEFAAQFAQAYPDDPQGRAWAREAFELNIGFFSRMVRGRPWVRMKIAASLDGQTALADGTSQWITSEPARADGHAWRRRAGAVLTGIGTVRDDDPRLDVRLVPTARQPMRVVVDSRLEIDPAARILQPPGAVLVCCGGAPGADGGHAHEPRGAAGGPPLAEDRPPRDAALGHRADKARALTRWVVADPTRAATLPPPRLEVAGPWEGVEVMGLPTDARGKTDLAALMAELATRGVNELHVEAGEKLNGSLLQTGLVDELLLYVAPKLLGPGRGLASLAPLERLADALALEFIECTPVGPDLRIRARPPGRADFLIGMPADSAQSGSGSGHGIPPPGVASSSGGPQNLG